MVFRPAAGGASGHYAPAGERVEIDPLAGRGGPGAEDAARPRLVFVVGEERRWAMLGLRVGPDDSDRVAVKYRGGPTWSVELSYREPIEVRGTWRSPVVVLPVRDEREGLATYERWLSQSVPGPP